MTQQKITFLPSTTPELPSDPLQPARWRIVFPVLSVLVSIAATISTWAILFYSGGSNRWELLTLFFPFFLWAATPYLGLVVLSFWARRSTMGAVLVLLATLLLAGFCVYGFYDALYFPVRSTSALVIVQAPLLQWMGVAATAGVWWALFGATFSVRSGR